MEDSLWDATFAVTLYCVLSPILTWLNKFVLVVPFCSQGLRNGPFLVTFFQQLSTFLVLTMARISTSLVSMCRKSITVEKKHQKDGKDSNQMEPQLSFLSDSFLKSCELAPAAACFVAQLTLCNACLRAVPMSSYQATRSSSLIFSIIVNRVILCEPISIAAFLSSFVVGIGFVLSVFDSAQTTCYSSVILGILASLAGVLFMTICRSKVCKGDRSETEIARWVSFNSSIFLIPFVIYEFGTIYEYGSNFWAANGNNNFGGNNVYGGLSTAGAALIATMLLAPIIPLCTTTCLRYMTPLGCTIVGFTKTCVQTVLGNWMFGDPLSIRSCMGVVLCVSGCCMYSFSGKVTQLAKRRMSWKKLEEPLDQSENNLYGMNDSPLLRRASITSDFESNELHISIQRSRCKIKRK